MKRLAPWMLLWVSLAILAQGAESRRLMRLDGRWEVEGGNASQPPPAYHHKVNIPGAMAVAEPAWPKAADDAVEMYWLRRTVQISGEVPPVAILRTGPALYGAQVLLNGGPAGGHNFACTPGYFDLRPLLRGNGEKNELIIGVGASGAAVPGSLPPGLEAAAGHAASCLGGPVELLLTGTPYFRQIRCQSGVSANLLWVHAVLANPSPAVTNALQFTVRELKTGRVVGRTNLTAQVFGTDAVQWVETAISIGNSHPWSPADPFLYELEARSAGDETRVRFGLRELRFDFVADRLLLNGKAFEFAGGQVDLGALFTNPSADNLPYNREWVRELFRRFHSWRWNAVRFCGAQPPEFWLDLADEMGLIVLLEYPFGAVDRPLNPALQPGQFNRCAEWAQVGDNHPAAIFWDPGQLPKTPSPLHLENEKRDVWWAPAQLATDAYLARPMLRGNRDAWLKGLPDAAEALLAMNFPAMTNAQFACIAPGWLQPATNRFAHALHMASVLEWWRARPANSGFFHYLDLGTPAEPGSGVFAQLSKLQMDPEIEASLRDPYAAVAVMLNFWADQLPRGSTNQFHIELNNCASTASSGRLQFRLVRAGKELLKQIQPAVLAAGTRVTNTFACPIPKEYGDYSVEALWLPEGGAPVRSRREFSVLTPAALAVRHGLAFGKPATASSFASLRQETCPPEFAVDGRPDTAWISQPNDAEWLVIDLHDNVDIQRVELCWGQNFGKRYFLDVSSDALNWQVVHQATAGQGGREVINLNPPPARYLRWRGTQRAFTNAGYKLWEMRVFGK